MMIGYAGKCEEGWRVVDCVEENGPMDGVGDWGGYITKLCLPEEDGPMSRGSKWGRIAQSCASRKRMDQ